MQQRVCSESSLPWTLLVLGLVPVVLITAEVDEKQKLEPHRDPDLCDEKPEDVFEYTACAIHILDNMGCGGVPPEKR